MIFPGILPPGDSYDPNVPEVKKSNAPESSKVSSEKLDSNKQLSDLQNLNNMILATETMEAVDAKGQSIS